MPTFCIIGGDIMAILPVLVTKRLVIRNININDADDMFEYAKTDLVGPTAGWQPHRTIHDTRMIITNFLNIQSNGELGVWSIVEKTTGKMIGTIELYNYTYRFMAELGYSLNPNYWGKGIMVEASQAVLDYAFNVLRIRRLEVGTFVTNHQSIRVCEKLGFKEEGILRNSYLRYDGTIFDKIVFGMTDTEYYQMH